MARQVEIFSPNDPTIKKIMRKCTFIKGKSLEEIENEKKEQKEDEKAPSLEEKWAWMMDWCKKQRVSPGEPYWWNKAEEEFLKQKCNDYDY